MTGEQKQEFEPRLIEEQPVLRGESRAGVIQPKSQADHHQLKAEQEHPGVEQETGDLTLTQYLSKLAREENTSADHQPDTNQPSARSSRGEYTLVPSSNINSADIVSDSLILNVNHLSPLPTCSKNPPPVEKVHHHVDPKFINCMHTRQMSSISFPGRSKDNLDYICKKGSETVFFIMTKKSGL